MRDVKLTYLVDTDEEVGAVRGSAYATGGWVTVEVLPFWAAAPLPAVVIAKWARDDDDRVHTSMASYLQRHGVKPI